jgi:ABC-type branched-subunit amino acid transport system ATPase component
MSFELLDVHAGYDSREILTGKTLSVKSGEIVAFIGSNGAGKSTVLKVASGFILPRQGRITFDGVDITYLEIKKRMSLV